VEVQDAIKTRRTIRSFKATPIDDKTLETILNAGRLASSWGNSQTWRWVVVKDKN